MPCLWRWCIKLFVSSISALLKKDCHNPWGHDDLAMHVNRHGCPCLKCEPMYHWSLLLNFSPCTLFFDHLPCCLAQLFDSNPRNPPTSWIQVKMNSSPNIPVIASKMGIQYMPKYGQVNRRAWATVWHSGLIPKTIHQCTEKWTLAQLPYGCVLILTNLPACW